MNNEPGETPEPAPAEPAEPSQRELLLPEVGGEPGSAAGGSAAEPQGSEPRIALDAPPVFVPVRRFRDHFEYRAQRLLTSRGRRLFLQVGLPWFAAVLVGVVGYLYARWIRDAYDLFRYLIHGRAWLAFIITPALTVLGVYGTRRWFYGAEGGGISQVIAAIHGPRENNDTVMKYFFGLRIIIGKIAMSLLGFLGGLSIGPEGPTVHLGAAIMAETRHFYPQRTRALERRLLLAGAAAGLSAAFNTPLAGVIFAIEELARDFETRTNGTMITAAVFAGLTTVALAGNYMYFGQLNVTSHVSVAFVFPVIVATVLCGLLGAAFSYSLVHWRKWLPARVSDFRSRKPLWWAFLLAMIIATVGVATRGQTWGSGYDQARALLHGTAPLSMAFGMTKWVSIVLTNLVGIPGGLFSPSLAIGAGIAQWVHAMFSWTSMAAVIALCMAGYLAAVTQSPLTSFVIVMEMTNGTAMVIPLMAVALASARLSGLFTPPLYHALAEERYYHYEPPPESAPGRAKAPNAAAAV
jgi:H+/Cl- antiporter ClcA